MAAGLMIAAAGALRQIGSLSCAKMLIAEKEQPSGSSFPKCGKQKT